MIFLQKQQKITTTSIATKIKNQFLNYCLCNSYFKIFKKNRQKFGVKTNKKTANN